MRHPRPHISCLKVRPRLISILLLAVIYFSIYGPPLKSTQSTPPLALNIIPHPTTPPTQSSLRIQTATTLYTPSNTLFEAALALHNPSSPTRYTTHTLRTPLLRGALSELYHIQHLITTNLLLPPQHRTNWLLVFHTPGAILTNPELPLHSFLPPVTDWETFSELLVIGTKDERGEMGMGVWWVRVCAGALRLLSEVVVEVLHGEEGGEGDGDGGVLGRALQRVLEKDGEREKVVWQPREWYNGSVEVGGGDGDAKVAVFAQPWARTHLDRLIGLEEALGVLKQQEDVKKEQYPTDEAIHTFWRSVTEARKVLQEAKDRGHTAERSEWRDIVGEIREWVELRTWETEIIDVRVAVLRDGLGMN
ncbi:hypothetical protein NX059_010279 [Plenodomus lindquistii]|nr:hypothetical protein NX059_010279 [Plenodomus lindquistii]